MLVWHLLQSAATEEAVKKQAKACRAAAELEAEVGSLLEVLSATLQATREQIEKRSAMTLEEHQAELAEAELVKNLAHTYHPSHQEYGCQTHD
jgi:hypothetical protein